MAEGIDSLLHVTMCTDAVRANKYRSQVVDMSIPDVHCSRSLWLRDSPLSQCSAPILNPPSCGEKHTAPSLAATPNLSLRFRFSPKYRHSITDDKDDDSVNRDQKP